VHEAEAAVADLVGDKGRSWIVVAVLARSLVGYRLASGSRRFIETLGGGFPVLLYDNDISGNCYKVRLLLSQLEIPFERRQLSVFDRSDRSAVLGELNPALRVPTLVLDDGRPLAESNAILCYLARGTSMLPDEPYEQAQTMQWLFFEQYSHEPNIAVARFWAHAGIAPSDGDRERTTTGGQAALTAMDRHLDSREFFVADRYTIADIALYAYTHVAPEGGFALDSYPALRAWLGRVASEPGHIAITA